MQIRARFERMREKMRLFPLYVEVVNVKREIGFSDLEIKKVEHGLRSRCDENLDCGDSITGEEELTNCIVTTSLVENKCLAAIPQLVLSCQEQ
jgi:hypothetical protein